jgi:hypothetical protein
LIFRMAATSDAGPILVQKLDERLGFSNLMGRYFTDSRAKIARLPFADLLRRLLLERSAAYEDVNDAEPGTVGISGRLMSAAVDLTVIIPGLG